MALALLGLIAAAFLGSLATAAQATFIADERATAESLARSQMEYVKNQTYIDYSADPHDVYLEITPPASSASYNIETIVTPIDPDTGQNQGIQKITVTVEHNDNQVFTLEGYKVDRDD